MSIILNMLICDSSYTGVLRFLGTPCEDIFLSNQNLSLCYTAYFPYAFTDSSNMIVILFSDHCVNRRYCHYITVLIITETHTLAHTDRYITFCFIIVTTFSLIKINLILMNKNYYNNLIKPFIKNLVCKQVTK